MGIINWLDATDFSARVPHSDLSLLTFLPGRLMKWLQPYRIGKYGVRSPKFIWVFLHSCTHWLRLRNSPPPPAFGLIYGGAIGQPRETTSLCDPLPHRSTALKIHVRPMLLSKTAKKGPLSHFFKGTVSFQFQWKYQRLKTQARQVSWRIRHT
jgi:hypothetical protein